MKRLTMNDGYILNSAIIINTIFICFYGVALAKLRPTSPTTFRLNIATLGREPFTHCLHRQTAIEYTQ